MVMWDTERILKFRDKLISELKSPQELWYYQNKLENRDLYVIRPECPYAISKKGIVAEQRYIWWLNHPNDSIKYNEEIHHINGDHHDNRIENLEKLSRKEHKNRHIAIRKMLKQTN